MKTILLSSLVALGTGIGALAEEEMKLNWVMDEVMSGRMSEADGMVEMARAQEMMREEARARTTHPEHRWED